MDISISGIDFEKHNLLKQIVRVPLVWFLGILPPKISHRLFTEWSNDAKQASRWAKTYKALEIIYTFPERRVRGEVSIGDIFWQTILSNARAVRNRLKLIEHLLKNLIVERSVKTEPVRILSLGSGAGRALIETVATLDREVSVKVAYFDRSRSAIKFSQRLSKEIIGDEKQNNFQWVCTKTENLQDSFTDFSPDIVEMVGLLDYFDEAGTKELFRLIYKHLSPNGYFIVSNVMPNIERPVVTNVVKWPLIYRMPNQLEDLLIDGGFEKGKIELFVEPLKIHAIAVCRKT